MWMNYKIEIKNKAKKFLLRQNPEVQKRILKAIYNIPHGDIKRLVGQDGLYRLRVGDYRVIYSIDYNKVIIIILNIGNRGEIYNSL
ncbi:MAG: type II toxin-antitoxin system RelE/ParE family toxin [Tissierella sp.]|nr:type II toxin-antitoxin system RelE/ParE family toxin [Tissierella sp.]